MVVIVVVVVVVDMLVVVVLKCLQHAILFANSFLEV